MAGPPLRLIEPRRLRRFEETPNSLVRLSVGLYLRTHETRGSKMVCSADRCRGVVHGMLLSQLTEGELDCSSSLDEANLLVHHEGPADNLGWSEKSIPASETLTKRR